MLKDFEGILNRLISDARDLNPILLWAISMPELYIEAVRRQTEEEIFLETLSILDLVLLDVKLRRRRKREFHNRSHICQQRSCKRRDKMPKSDIKETSAGMKMTTMIYNQNATQMQFKYNSNTTFWCTSFRGKATTPMSQRKKHTPGLASEVQG
ncbi:hypothetical protein V1477_010161 [Vespula maculifrons]|uniref:Uncharacterized protein n=1 Tax=Vespula maculifrons TaxID=7453 RepID=A0ABD2C8E7_VESMC